MGTRILLIVAMIVAALFLLLLEVLTPVFGLLAAMALVAMAAAVWLGFTISPVLGIVMIVALAVGIPVYLVALVRALPRLPGARRLFLFKVSSSGQGDGTPEASGLKDLIGRTGRALTPLRPSGMVRIDAQRVNAVAESGMIDSGAEVRVISAGGTEVVVRRIGG